SLVSRYKEVMRSSALPALVGVLKDRKRHRVQTVRSTVFAILTVEPDPKQVLPIFLEAAQDSDPAIVEVLVRGLFWLARKDPAVRPLLLSALQHRDVKVRIAAAGALGHGGIKAKEAIPGLLTALKDSRSAELRATAATSLAWQGPEAKAAIPNLHRALD